MKISVGYISTNILETDDSGIRLVGYVRLEGITILTLLLIIFFMRIIKRCWIFMLKYLT
jgi:hypothetical protein